MELLREGMAFLSEALSLLEQFMFVMALDMWSYHLLNTPHVWHCCPLAGWRNETSLPRLPEGQAPWEQSEHFLHRGRSIAWHGEDIQNTREIVEAQNLERDMETALIQRSHVTDTAGARENHDA